MDGRRGEFQYVYILFIYLWQIRLELRSVLVSYYILFPIRSRIASKKGLQVNLRGNGDKVGKVEGSDNEYAAIYSEKGYTFSASASGMAASGFAISYYKEIAEGEWEIMSGNPKEVGRYKIVVS